MGIKCDKDPLAVEQNNYLTKIVNFYIVCDLEAWPKIPLRNLTLKNCLFGATNIVKNSDKEKYMYSGYGITFDGNGKWNFGNGYVRNDIIVGVNNSSSSHAGNLTNNVLILGEGYTFAINGSFDASENKFSIIFSKSNTKFCLLLHYNDDNSYLFVSEK